MPNCSTAGCGKPARSRGLCKTHYNRTMGYGWASYVAEPEKRRATWRAKNHRRRALSRAGYDEVTPALELALRRKAKRCPMPDCGVALMDEPYRPTSKELDHIVPRNIGGTHTMGNVRIICRQCNLQRPKDGSDFAGQPSLWAQDHDVAVVRQARRRPARRCSDCGTELTKSRRCLTCRPLVVRVARGRPRYVPASHLSAEQRRDRAQKAAAMRADGQDWWDIADALGFGRASSAHQAASGAA